MPTHRYLATFAAGFEPVIGELLSESLSGAILLRTESGMILFECSANGKLPRAPLAT